MTLSVPSSHPNSVARRLPIPYEHESSLRRLIRSKLADGRLPRIHIPRIWGGMATGEECAACDEIIPSPRNVIGAKVPDDEMLHFHPRCFYLWDGERMNSGASQVPGRPGAGADLDT
jgi:hypothetical protein